MHYAHLVESEQPVHRFNEHTPHLTLAEKDFFRLAFIYFLEEVTPVCVLHYDTKLRKGN
jgi:hypothetical protein